MTEDMPEDVKAAAPRIRMVFGRISEDGVEAVNTHTGVSAKGKTLVEAMAALDRKERRAAAIRGDGNGEG